MSDKKPFAPKIILDDDHLIGARWWQEGFLFLPDPESRRAALKKLAIAGGVVAGGWSLISLIQWASAETFEDALALQRAEGWDVGAKTETLSFPDVVPTTVTGEPMVQDLMRVTLPLAKSMTPRQSRLTPYYVPTLFQSMDSSSHSRLRQLMRFINTPEMKLAYEGATAMRELLSAPLVPEGLGILVDMPGPAAIAFAGGLRELYDPVFLFDNWPHPKGVVPAHLTLAAALYYEPYFSKLPSLSSGAKLPPLFVLDANRLNSYTSEQDKFDNRYVAKLPSSQNLKDLGVTRLLYVSLTERIEELDDLNNDFVDYLSAGIAVKLFGLTGNFSVKDPAATLPMSAPVSTSAPTSLPGTSAPTSAPGTTPAPISTPAPAVPVVTTQNNYYFRGNPYMHSYFWAYYGWVPRPPGLVMISLPGATYAPRARTTLFSSSGSGSYKSRPKSFGSYSSKSSSSYSSKSRSGSYSRSYSSSSS